jgi:hypothetical protein
MKRVIILASLVLMMGSCNFVHDLFMPKQTWSPGSPRKTHRKGPNHVVHRENANSAISK